MTFIYQILAEKAEYPVNQPQPEVHKEKPGRCDQLDNRAFIMFDAELSEERLLIPVPTTAKPIAR
jgi:hypothetical protein